jgi:hypothetical protein
MNHYKENEAEFFIKGNKVIAVPCKHYKKFLLEEMDIWYLKEENKKVINKLLKNFPNMQKAILLMAKNIHNNTHNLVEIAMRGFTEKNIMFNTFVQCSWCGLLSIGFYHGHYYKDHEQKLHEQMTKECWSLKYWCEKHKGVFKPSKSKKKFHTPDNYYTDNDTISEEKCVEFYDVKYYKK